MSIPEPSFQVTVYQLMNIIQELNNTELFDIKNINYLDIRTVNTLRNVCYNHLDTEIL